MRIAIVEFKEPEKYRSNKFTIPEGVDIEKYLKYVAGEIQSYILKEVQNG